MENLSPESKRVTKVYLVQNNLEYREEANGQETWVQLLTSE